MKENLIINPGITDNSEEKLETTLRPQMLDEYIGQTKVKESMIPFIIGCVVVFGAFGIWKAVVLVFM